MRLALKLATNGMGMTSPNPMVGAVIVRNDRMIGSGWHVRAGEAHAEINALSSVRGNAKGATVYVTLEPCSSYGRTPPCCDALIEAGVERVVIGSLDPNPKHAGRGIELLEKNGIETVYGIEKERCDELNEAFFKWITLKKPFVLLKLAITLDGRIATEGGSSQWITSKMALKRVAKLRLWADAVMGGAETFKLDKPRFTARNSAGELLKTPRRIIATHHPERLEIPDGWETVALDTRYEWDEFLLRMGEESITSLLIEGGGRLAASALNAGVIDKVEMHIAPKILGGENSRPAVGGINPTSIDEAIQLEKTSMRHLGVDYMISGYPKGKN